MQGVKEAIILLKQYGTPVFASAVAASKFAAYAGIFGGAAVAILCFVLLWRVLPMIQDKVAGVDGATEPEDNQGIRIMAWIFAIVIALLAISFCIGGFYDLVSLDYQAYKLMLFK